MTEETRKLSKQEQVFIDEYLVSLNGTDAYIKAYPKSKRSSARANASRLIAKDYIRAEIDRIFRESHMSADEALKLQTDIARGDVTDFLDTFGQIDIEELRGNGKGRLIKKIRQRTITKIGKGEKDDDTEIHETEIELYPADVAQERILRIAGKIAPREVTIKVNLTDD